LRSGRHVGGSAKRVEGIGYGGQVQLLSRVGHVIQLGVQGMFGPEALCATFL
jgi:hypothetical protein